MTPAVKQKPPKKRNNIIRSDRRSRHFIKEALERDEFDNLPGKGKPIDLTEYFETPEEIRLANSVLKNAGMTSREVDLLKEIAELKQILVAILDETKKQVEFSLMMERQKRLGRRR